MNGKEREDSTESYTGNAPLVAEPGIGRVNTGPHDRIRPTGTHAAGIRYMNNAMIEKRNSNRDKMVLAQETRPNDIVNRRECK